MARLTRKEMQMQTRRRLLEAAEREFASRGIEAASLRGIAESAGYSLGAVYSNFESKEALLRELLATHMRREMGLIRGVLSDSGATSPADSLGKLRELLRAMRSDAVLSGLVVEFHIHASRNPEFRRQFMESKGVQIAALADGLGAIFRRWGVKPRIDAHRLAQGFSALWVGFLVQGTDGGGDCAEDVTLFLLEEILNGARPRKGSGAPRARRSPGRG